MKGVSAVIATILMLIITIALAGTAYMYISGVFSTSTMAISVVDSYCSSNTATLVVRNQGTTDMAAASLTITSINEACGTDPVAAAISAGNTTTFTALTCTSGRSHTFRMRGPSNAVELSVYCA